MASNRSSSIEGPLPHPVKTAAYMPLKMRPTGLGSRRLQGQFADYSVFCGEWCIGRIYQTRTGPESLRWFWALHAPSKPGEMRTSNQVATLEVAKAEFEAF